ncbi:MAG: undecaprenyl-diphosphate phosphatase [Deltaproteobacteria bacterium]|nr:undecaprenyl-diphosphate phosphatase [Deltaproteobacteria bacterium]
MSIINAIILGIIQGLTEFLPVSSSGHLVIAEHLLPGWHQTGIVFEILLHLATLLAVIIFFRRDIFSLIKSLYTKGPEATSQRRLLMLLILATIPTGIIGLAGKKFFVSLFDRLDVVGVMLLVTAGFLWLAERPKIYRTKGWGRIRDAVLIGITQGLAIIPGISRSGSTIAVAMMLGIKPERAARFSFLLSIPAISGAALLNLKEISSIPHGQITAALCGALAALITGLISLKLLIMIIKERRLRIFAIYCTFAGCGALWLAFAG